MKKKALPLIDVYLDNAATSFPKPKRVVDELYRCVVSYCGNPGRSGHGMSMYAAEKIYEAREIISAFFGLSEPEKVCFTQNSTSSLNTVIKGLIKNKCHVIISDAEHNSVLRPLFRLKSELNIEISRFDSDKPLRKSVIPLIRKDTGFLICNLTSNVTGKEIDLNEIKEIADKYKLALILDASQSAGHKKIDLNGIKRGALCCAGHKALFGIQGSGFFVLLGDTLPSVVFEGGSGSDSFNKRMPDEPPEKYEAGTLSCPAIVTLSEGIKFINSVGIENITDKINRLTSYTLDRLNDLKDIHIYGANSGIISFNKEGLSSFETADMLSERSIAVRGGFHCAPEIHKKLGTEKRGTVRISYSYLNTFSDADRLIEALKNEK